MLPHPYVRSLARYILAFVLLGPSAAGGAEATDPGATQILKWKGGKQACFILAFDDGAHTQLKYAIPELEARGLVGTFYLVTGNGLYAGLKAKWEAAARSPSVVVANHTFTHKGVTSAAELEPELARCNEVLYALHPERKRPRLLAFGHPGGVPWNVTKEELEPALARHHLFNRPPFSGPPMHYPSAEAMVTAVDRALAAGEMGHLDFHGVGGDWLVTPLEWFRVLLDKLVADRDRLWITDTASWHKYVQTRAGAEVKVLERSPERIRLAFTAKTDPALYDEPLTLSTKVPPAWTNCLVAHRASGVEVAARDGAVQYDALAGGGEITIQPVAGGGK